VLGHVREYTTSDLDACLSIFRSNLPVYVAPFEEAGYRSFLERPPGPYLVLEMPGSQIVAAGGYAMEAEGMCSLCWGLVERRWHRRGFGRALLTARLDAIAREGVAHTIRLSTSQHTRGFFERFGFVAIETIPNGIAPGIDRIEMRLHAGDISNEL
jgi:GNAT superfamily N-acetyltransferase